MRKMKTRCSENAVKEGIAGELGMVSGHLSKALNGIFQTEGVVWTQESQSRSPIGNLPNALRVEPPGLKRSMKS